MGAPMLTPGEERAEELLYAAISRKYTYSEFLIEAHHLERESPEGAAYLRVLHARFIATDTWPTVRGGSRVNICLDRLL